MKRHAEIAGAGFSGLALAVSLAERGWSVRVHERAPEVREIGAGIFLHNNGLLVLEAMGVMPELVKMGTSLTHERMIDARGRALQNRSLVSESRVWSFPREAVIRTLLETARAHGVEVQCSSHIVSATRDGTITDSNGHIHHADLVVGADGHHSVVRESLGLTERQVELPTTSLRFLISDRSLAPDPVTTEHWSESRRIALAACGESNTYVYMACPAADSDGSAAPIDVDSWTESFPNLGKTFQRLHQEQVHKSQYSLVTCRAWSLGRAAVVGDAAHALAPTLGQGTNLALANTRSLAAFLAHEPEIESALTKWEHAVRHVADATQRWAGIYDQATKHWPRKLWRVRSGVIWAFGTSPRLNARLRLADRTPPIMPDRAVAPGSESLS